MLRRCSWMLKALVLSAMLAASAASAQEKSPESGQEKSQESAPPLPPPRPGTTPAPAPGQAAGAPAPADAADEASLDEPACFAALARLGIRFEPRPRIEDGACSVPAPVLVSGLPDGVEVSPPALMTCPVAEGLARWTLDVLLAEADRHFGSAPTKLLIGTSYECRNQRSGTKVSEHAFGNGVDVMGFEFHKRAPVAIGSHPEGSPEAAFQSAIQKGACGAFTTVLGPGSDAAHGDHLHLDMRGRRGGYRICQ